MHLEVDVVDVGHDQVTWKSKEHQKTSLQFFACIWDIIAISRTATARVPQADSEGTSPGSLNIFPQDRVALTVKIPQPLHLPFLWSTWDYIAITSPDWTPQRGTKTTTLWAAILVCRPLVKPILKPQLFLLVLLLLGNVKSEISLWSFFFCER